MPQLFVTTIIKRFTLIRLPVVDTADLKQSGKHTGGTVMGWHAVWSKQDALCRLVQYPRTAQTVTLHLLFDKSCAISHCRVTKKNILWTSGQDLCATSQFRLFHMMTTVTQVQSENFVSETFSMNRLIYRFVGQIFGPSQGTLVQPDAFKPTQMPQPGAPKGVWLKC